MQTWHSQLFKLFAFEWCEELHWQIDNDGTLKFSVDCEDDFTPGPDSQEVTEADIPALYQAKADMTRWYWPNLWVARRRRQAPAGLLEKPYIKDPEHRALFEQAATAPAATSTLPADLLDATTGLQDWHEELLKLFSLHQDDLWWRQVEDSRQLTFFVTCSDTFDWGSADLEEVGDDDISELSQAKADLPDDDWPLLWVCRKRKMRPMNEYMERVAMSTLQRQLLEQAAR